MEFVGAQAEREVWRAYFSMWWSRSNTVLICERRSGS